jgi:Leucine Rich repeat
MMADEKSNEHEVECDRDVDSHNLAALETLMSHGLLRTVDGSEGTTQLIASWDDKVQFDDGGNVVLIDFHGQRLHRGFPCAHHLLGPNHFPQLTTLNLAGTDLPIGDTMSILDQVRPHIESVYLGGNGLGVEGARTLSTSWLPSASALLKLDLRYNDIEGVGMEAICEALAFTQVKDLYVEGNRIGDSGATALSNLLKDPKSPLERVFMGANQIHATGAEALASSLYANKTISKIYLEGNNIGSEGADCFSAVLEELQGNTGLKSLFVDNNNIGKQGSKRLAKALNIASVIEDSNIYDM